MLFLTPNQQCQSTGGTVPRQWSSWDRHPFNCLFSRTTLTSQHYKGQTILDLIKQEMMGWQRHQLDHMQIIRTSLETDIYASTSSLNFLQATRKVKDVHLLVRYHQLQASRTWIMLMKLLLFTHSLWVNSLMSIHINYDDEKHSRRPWNIFFGWLIIAKILLLQHNQHFYLDVSVSIRDLHTSEEVCSIPLPVLVVIVMRQEKKDGSLWTGTRAATRWATRTTDFLPRRITIVARTRRGFEQTSSDEGLW